MLTLTKDEQATLINYAMQAEGESYNRYFLDGLLGELKSLDLTSEKTANILQFLREASACTFRLYCELMFKSMAEAQKQSISFKV